MPIHIPETQQEKLEVALWLGGQGDVTAAVQRRITRYGLTFGAALITREMRETYRWN